MNIKSLLALGGVCALALLVVLVIVDRPESVEGQGGGELLLPGLEAAINDIEAIDIVSLDGSTVATLRRERGRWRMREKHDYEADFARIHDLLRDLAQSERLEARTSNPDWYERLGVAAVGEGTASRAAVRFPGSEIPGLIIGTTDPGGIGRYVRLEGQAQSWLTTQPLGIPVERVEWLERAIMDIPASDMRSVTVRHPGGEVAELRPGDAEGSVWVLLNAPEDREVKQAWQLRQRANALAKLNLVDVRPHDPDLLPADAVESIYRTRDGLVFTATLFADDAGHWVHFSVTAAEPSGEGGSPQKSASASDRGADSSEAAESETHERSIDAVAVDGRLSPWQYGIDKERFDRLTTSLEELLVPPAAADNSGGGSD